MQKVIAFYSMGESLGLIGGYVIYSRNFLKKMSRIKALRGTFVKEKAGNFKCERSA